MVAPYIPKLLTLGNFKLENFNTADEQTVARDAVAEVQQLCSAINEAIGPDKLEATTDLVQAAFLVWFDVHNNDSYGAVKGNLLRLNAAHRAGITLVYRPNIIVRDSDGVPALLPDQRPFIGDNVFGYIHNHVAGAGYRIVCGKYFMDDKTPFFASTTIYHEMSHKVLNTVDFGYGSDRCKNLATAGKGPQNADNYAYFAISIASGVAPEALVRKALPTPGAPTPKKASKPLPTKPLPTKPLPTPPKPN